MSTKYEVRHCVTSYSLHLQSVSYTRTVFAELCTPQHLQFISCLKQVTFHIGIEHQIKIMYFFGSFAKLRKPAVSYVMSVSSEWNSSASTGRIFMKFNPLNPELNRISYLLALLAHHFLHVSKIRVKSLTIRLLMSYIYGAPIFDVSRSHTTTQHSR